MMNEPQRIKTEEYDSKDNLKEPKPAIGAFRHPSAIPGEGQPPLLRTSQVPSGSAANPTKRQESAKQIMSKAILKVEGDLNAMAVGWTPDEWAAKRRLVQFWRHQEGNVIQATFKPIKASDYKTDAIVISCIFREDNNECFVTSVDAIYLLEAMIGSRFSVEEKNRIRRNLEGFKPITVTKSKADSEAFFKLIMGFPSPKPRNIEKDVKAFPWKILGLALRKIIGKVGG
jgi:hypothetical protein